MLCNLCEVSNFTETPERYWENINGWSHFSKYQCIFLFKTIQKMYIWNYQKVDIKYVSKSINLSFHNIIREFPWNLKFRVDLHNIKKKILRFLEILWYFVEVFSTLAIRKHEKWSNLPPRVSSFCSFVN